MKAKIWTLAISIFMVMFAVSTITYSQTKEIKTTTNKIEKQQIEKKNEIKKPETVKTTGVVEQSKINNTKEMAAAGKEDKVKENNNLSKNESKIEKTTVHHKMRKNRSNIQNKIKESQTKEKENK